MTSTQLRATSQSPSTMTHFYLPTIFYAERQNLPRSTVSSSPPQISEVFTDLINHRRQKLCPSGEKEVLGRPCLLKDMPSLPPSSLAACTQTMAMYAAYCTGTGSTPESGYFQPGDQDIISEKNIALKNKMPPTPQSWTIHLKPFDLSAACFFLDNPLESLKSQYRDSEYIKKFSHVDQAKMIQGIAQATGGKPYDLIIAVERTMKYPSIPIIIDINIWKNDVSLTALALLQSLSFFDADNVVKSILIPDSPSLKAVNFGDYPTTKEKYDKARQEFHTKYLAHDGEYSPQSSCTPYYSLLFEPAYRKTSSAQPLSVTLFRSLARDQEALNAEITATNIKGSMGVVRLMNEGSWYLHAKGRSTEIADCANIAISIFQHIPDQEKKTNPKPNLLYSQALKYRAIASIFKGELKARKPLQEAIKLIKYRITTAKSAKDLNKANLELADAYNLTGMAYMREFLVKKMQSYISRNLMIFSVASQTKRGTIRLISNGRSLISLWYTLYRESVLKQKRFYFPSQPKIIQRKLTIPIVQISRLRRAKAIQALGNTVELRNDQLMLLFFTNKLSVYSTV
ncbi:hypothetical protein QBC38DRAFT_526402 [Podospora fimiseda]|uniref:Uncharacterized protein n=1 Tax=Podospora fimiseda TaxID=252190 RepID=A0AAN6YJS6_9PEZI|nr:hypothetical protein QBC38DRAFT_526402 [Podospora fimiseda]